MRSLNGFLTLSTLSLACVGMATVNSVNSGHALLGNRGSNLVSNGSFEADNGFYANNSYWAAGTTLTPFVPLTAWNTSGGPQSYAVWGNDGSGGTEGSAALPDGTSGLYFGASIMVPSSSQPIFGPNGVVTFAGTPTFTPKPGFGPVTLSQTVTGLNTSQAYLLDFWASGEDAGGLSQFNGDGFFGLDISGESRIYLTSTYAGSSLGTSRRHYIDFTPTTSSVTFTWTNWGHYVLPTGGLSTELVLDDVILNPRPVPEPASMAAFGIGIAAILRRRRSR